MRILLMIYFGFFLNERGLCQNTSHSIENIKAYVKMVDSLSSIKTYLKIDKEEQVKLVLSLSEGTIEDKKRRLKGGFSVVTITNSDSDTVYSIQKHDNLEKNLYQSYYFQSDKLVFSRIELKNDDDKNDTLFLQEEYYADNKMILSVIDKSKLKKKYKWRTDIDHVASAYYYLMEFKKR